VCVARTWHPHRRTRLLHSLTDLTHPQVDEADLAKLDALFDALDADGSGSLDTVEWRRASTTGHVHLPPPTGVASAGPGGRGRYAAAPTSGLYQAGTESPTDSGPAGFERTFELTGQHSEDSEAIDDSAALIAAGTQSDVRSRARLPMLVGRS
jgi:hypothetical protein